MVSAISPPTMLRYWVFHLTYAAIEGAATGVEDSPSARRCLRHRTATVGAAAQVGIFAFPVYVERSDARYGRSGALHFLYAVSRPWVSPLAPKARTGWGCFAVRPGALPSWLLSGWICEGASSSLGWVVARQLGCERTSPGGRKIEAGDVGIARRHGPVPFQVLSKFCRAPEGERAARPCRVAQTACRASVGPERTCLSTAPCPESVRAGT